ncbi:MAG: hypothetical protein JWP38_1135 [Herbaspirillum sp.]|jgi:hypothetical protein|nr:hypothetical protein [Herbaspirillum sp.]
MKKIPTMAALITAAVFSASAFAESAPAPALDRTLLLADTTGTTGSASDPSTVPQKSTHKKPRKAKKMKNNSGETAPGTNPNGVKGGAMSGG